IWRGARTGHLGAGWAGGISALLALSALLSPQYASWLAPSAGIAWVEKDTRPAGLATPPGFLSNLVWKSFHPLLPGAPGTRALRNAPNLLLVAIAFDAIRQTKTSR